MCCGICALPQLTPQNAHETPPPTLSAVRPLSAELLSMMFEKLSHAYVHLLCLSFLIQALVGLFEFSQHGLNMEQQLAHIASIVASIAALAAAPAAIALGVVPRVGPGRAFILALDSRLFLRAKPVSQRKEELSKLRKVLSNAHTDQYVVVVGPKGVGKTCVVNTATEKTFGVVSVRVPAGTPETTIMTDVFTAITRCNPRIMDLSASTGRVLWWHQLIFRTPATVVLRAAERKPTQLFADLDSAARALTNDYGLRVIIDASDNSLPENAKATKREKLVEVTPMSRSVLEEMPKLEELHAALKAADLADVVWACVDGVPADYLQLLGQWNDAGGGDLDVVVGPFVKDLLNKAISNKRSCVIANDRLQELYALFQEQSEVPDEVREKMKLARPSPDKVLRLKVPESGDDSRVLVPADAAMALVLRFAMTKPPPLKKLKEMVRVISPPLSPVAPSPVQNRGTTNV